MKYLLLLMADGEERPWGELTAEEQAVEAQRFEDFDSACRRRDGVQILAGEALATGEAATVVRTRGGQRAITDGPFAEAVEQLGGFYLIEAPDIDVILELLQILPAYDIQISPVVDPY